MYNTETISKVTVVINLNIFLPVIKEFRLLQILVTIPLNVNFTFLHIMILESLREVRPLTYSHTSNNSKIRNHKKELYVIRLIRNYN